MTNDVLNAQTNAPDIPSARIAWNLVAQNLREHPLLRKKLRRKIAKFERHLVHYPLDSLHLQIVLERHPTKLWHTASLSLRVPGQVFHVRKSDRNVDKAFDDAARALLRELIAFKRHLRREDAWKRRDRRASLHAGKVIPFSDEPLPEGTGPQSLRDVVRALVEKHHFQLLRYARRQLRHDELAGELPRGAVDAQVVVDVAVGRALLMPDRRPERLTFVPWLFALVREELERRRRAWRERQSERVRLGDIPERGAPHEGDAEQPFDLEEPAYLQPADGIPDIADDRWNPAEAACRRDLLAVLGEIVGRWPQPEREIFELHFVEGFDVEEIAMITRQTPSGIVRRIQSIQERLRDEVRGQALG